MGKCSIFLTALFLAIISLCVHGKPRINKAAYRSKNLGEACKQRSDCKPAFAICSKTCQCPEGFTIKNGKCVTSIYSCPIGDAVLGKDGKIQRCTRRQLPTSPSNTTSTVPSVLEAPQWEDSCGANKICVPESQDASVSPASWYGHCCAMPKAVCPIGVPSSNRCDLPFIYGIDDAEGLREKLACNISTHYCLSTTINGVELGTICCPRACLDSEVFANGLCFPRVKPGDTCELDEQCINGECKNEVCVCRKTDVIVDGNCVSPTCDDVTTFFDSDVKFSKPLRKADGAVVVCGTKDRSECPSDAYCSAKYAVCCPRPSLRCRKQTWYVRYGLTTTTTTEAPILPESRKCQPIPTKPTCGKQMICRHQYSHIKTDGSIEMFGVCCPDYDPEINNFANNLPSQGGAAPNTNNLQSNSNASPQQPIPDAQGNSVQQNNQQNGQANNIWQNWQGK